MGQVTPQIVEKFRTGGGLSYDDYPGFHDAQAEESAAVNDAALVDTIIPLTGLVDRLRAGIDVADVGCGEGHAINLLAREFPRQPLHRHRLQRRRPDGRSRRGRRVGPDQRELRDPGRARPSTATPSSTW